MIGEGKKTLVVDDNAITDMLQNSAQMIHARNKGRDRVGWDRKPRILLVSDSAALDTGFGRVIREIGTALVKHGGFNVLQLGWFHIPTDRIVPFRIIATSTAGTDAPGKDGYGQLSYEGVAARFKPDLVLCLGDEWMVRHLTRRSRNYLLVGYVPIDSIPVSKMCIPTFRAFDQLVLFGDFAASAVRQIDQKIDIKTIPHGVRTQHFRRLPEEDRKQFKQHLFGDPDVFVVGCVARNNERKCIPRLMKAFRNFINPSTTCHTCGNVVYRLEGICPEPGCGSKNVTYTNPKKNARLYVHASHDDPHGYPLLEVVERLGLLGYVGLPDGMRVGIGVNDVVLNELYNAFDVHTIATQAEGFCLPFLEGLAAGTPSLAPYYSAHVDFMQDVAEFVRISEFLVGKITGSERAIVDLDDYTMKLDRFYYERDDFLGKWGPLIQGAGYEPDDLKVLPCGKEYCHKLSQLGEERAQEYEWDKLLPEWVKLATDMLEYDAGSVNKDRRPTLSAEVV